MTARAATFVVLLFAVTGTSAETPPQQQAAIDALKGIPSNLQKNRDGTVRFVRFSKSIVTDEHVAKTAAFAELDYLAAVVPQVTDGGLTHVGKLTNLDTLFLSDSGITDKTLEKIKPLEKLQHLYLDRTKISDTGLPNVAEVPSLTTLSLADTKVSDIGVAYLSAMPHLEVLDLSGTQVSDVSIERLCTLPKLRFLSLNGTAITRIDKLADAVSLESLSLRETELHPDSLLALSKLKNLRQLNLRNTGLTAEDISKLQESNAKLNISISPSKFESRNALQRYLAGEGLQHFDGAAKTDEQPSGQESELSPIDQQLLAKKIVPDFQRHVIPLLGRLGCNGRTCHGSFQGKGGFNLSMFGYDFDADLNALTAGDDPRVDTKKIESSLILNKPTSEEEHGGGQRYKAGGWEYQLLHRWINAGAKGVKQPAKLLALQVTPAEVVFRKPGDTAQLKCVAVWENGIREDVTSLTRFQTNDDNVAEVSADGEIVCKSPGYTYVVSFYDNGIFSTQVMLPVSDQTGDRLPAVDTPTEVDRLVVRKLSQLGIVPSEVCNDEEFLRRVCLDLTGTLPSAAELEKFLADPSPGKRQHKVDELLQTEAYATWWAVKLADLTGSNSQSLGSTDMNTPASEQWNSWLKRRLQENVGWDRIAAGIILATSRRPGQSYQSYAAEQSLHMKRAGGTEFSSLGNPMHYYWFRGNNQTDTDRTLTFGYTFMGVRLQCAQCHKHPFDQWSKQDFDRFSGFFKRIRIGISPDGKASQTFLKTKLGVPKKLDTAALRRQMYLRVSAEGLAIPWNEVFIEPPGEKPLLAKIPGGEEFNLNEFSDPREPLFAWLARRDNPYFAPSFVNRVWTHYFGTGIVDPPDDFNMANPPSNKALLNWLSSQFIENGYNIKWLHRAIVNSDTYQRSSVCTTTNRTDKRNFSRAVVRRMPAEVTIDAIRRATARDDVAARFFDDMKGRKIGQHPRSFQARGIDYSLLIFGKPRRTTSCDCERQDQPTLLQSLYVRNDKEMLEWLERSDGWLVSVAKELEQSLSSDVKTVPTSDQQTQPQFADSTITQQLINSAYQRTLCRKPNAVELQESLAHIKKCENTVEGLRDIMWALLNTQEFLTTH